MIRSPLRLLYLLGKKLYLIINEMSMTNFGIAAAVGAEAEFIHLGYGAQ